MVETKMDKFSRATSVSVAFAGFALMLVGCMSVEEQRHVDANTCADYGAGYGSHSYTQCMLQQQQRRDQAQLITAESMRATSETQLNNLEMMRRLREGGR